MDPELLQMLMMGGGAGLPMPMVPGTPPPTPGMIPTGLPTGLPPPAPVPLMTTPGQVRPVEPYMTDPLAAPRPQITQPASLGASLEPMVPTPMPRPAEAPGGTYAAGGGPTGGGPTTADAQRLGAALKGVVAPQSPQAQKVSTPHAPTLAKLPGGNVAELLASLGIGPQQAFPGLKLPSTLGQALGGR